MIKFKNILAENMRRFGTKNLNEQTLDSGELEKILLKNFLIFRFPNNQNKIASWMSNYPPFDDVFYYMDKDPIVSNADPDKQIYKEYTNWLQKNGFERGDVYVNDGNANRVQQQILANGFK